MQTAWDLVTLLGFAGLITLFLQRSSQERPQDKLWQYAPPALACAGANYIGNNGNPVLAAVVLAAAALYVFMVLKPKLRS